MFAPTVLMAPQGLGPPSMRHQGYHCNSEPGLRQPVYSEKLQGMGQRAQILIPSYPMGQL